MHLPPLGIRWGDAELTVENDVAAGGGEASRRMAPRDNDDYFPRALPSISLHPGEGPGVVSTPPPTKIAIHS